MIWPYFGENYVWNWSERLLCFYEIIQLTKKIPIKLIYIINPFINSLWTSLVRSEKISKLQIRGFSALLLLPWKWASPRRFLLLNFKGNQIKSFSNSFELTSSMSTHIFNKTTMNSLGLKSVNDTWIDVFLITNGPSLNLNFCWHSLHI